METGIAYVQKVVDELNKNHREKDTEPITGFMLQFKNPDETVARLCPIKLFQTTLTYGNVKNQKFQQTKRTIGTSRNNLVITLIKSTRVSYLRRQI